MANATPSASLGFQNFFSALLTSDITSSSTDIPMDTIPNSSEGFLVIEPDSTTAREVIFYNSKTALKVVCPSAANGRGQDDTTAGAHSTGATVIMAPVSAFYEALQSFVGMLDDVKGGWYNAIKESESWTYSSYDSTNKTGVITVPSDATTRFAKGMRVRFTNNGSTQYGIITNLTSTTLTVYFGTDYSLTNAAITVPYFSPHKAPIGFPLSPVKWTVSVTDTSDRTQNTPTQNTWYNIGTTNSQIGIPIGLWRTYYEVTAGIVRSASASVGIRTTLSTANNTESDKNMTAYSEVQGPATMIDHFNTFHVEGIIDITSAATYYLNARNEFSSATSISFYGSTYRNTNIKAICAYL